MANRNQLKLSVSEALRRTFIQKHRRLEVDKHLDSIKF